MLTAKQIRGQQIEDFVCRHLQAAGLSLLTRNFKSRCGEIDIIMQEADTIVFVEVRFRQTAQFGGAIETIDRYKQQRICDTADVYLQRYDKEEKLFWRFDWVGVSPTTTGDYQIEWIKNAWEEDY